MLVCRPPIPPPLNEALPDEGTIDVGSNKGIMRTPPCKHKVQMVVSHGMAGFLFDFYIQVC